MDREEKANIGNCPHCTKIIFKDAVFNSEASFSMRCPHCNKTVRVIIRRKIEITILPVHDEHNQKKGPGPGILMILLVIHLPLVHCLIDNMDNIIDVFT